MLGLFNTLFSQPHVWYHSSTYYASHFVCVRDLRKTVHDALKQHLGLLRHVKKRFPQIEKGHSGPYSCQVPHV